MRIYFTMFLFLLIDIGLITCHPTPKPKPICPKIANFHGNRNITQNIGCCSKQTCGISLDPQDFNNIQLPSIPQYHLDLESDLSDMELLDSNLGKICPTKTVLIHPLFAEIPRENNHVQILQMPPILVQSVMLKLCIYPESRGIRGKCVQSYSTMELYTVDKINESVQFSKRFVPVPVGCDAIGDFRPIEKSKGEQKESDNSKNSSTNFQNLFPNSESYQSRQKKDYNKDNGSVSNPKESVSKQGVNLENIGLPLFIESDHF